VHFLVYFLSSLLKMHGPKNKIVINIFDNVIKSGHKNVSIFCLYSYLKDNPHLSHFINIKRHGVCVILHQSNAVNISHQTNPGLNIAGLFTNIHSCSTTHCTEIVEQAS